MSNSFDPSVIINACNEAHSFGQSSTKTMSQPYLNSTSDMSTASSQNAIDTISNVQGIGQQMLGQMNGIKNSINQQLTAHQDAQMRQKTYDFNVDMSDLRPTTAVGFPQEMPSNFFAPFRTGMK